MHPPRCEKRHHVAFNRVIGPMKGGWSQWGWRSIIKVDYRLDCTRFHTNHRFQGDENLNNLWISGHEGFRRIPLWTPHPWILFPQTSQIKKPEPLRESTRVETFMPRCSPARECRRRSGARPVHALCGAAEVDDRRRTEATARATHEFLRVCS